MPEEGRAGVALRRDGDSGPGGPSSPRIRAHPPPLRQHMPIHRTDQPLLGGLRPQVRADVQRVEPEGMAMSAAGRARSAVADLAEVVRDRPPFGERRAFQVRVSRFGSSVMIGSTGVPRPHDASMGTAIDNQAIHRNTITSPPRYPANSTSRTSPDPLSGSPGDDSSASGSTWLADPSPFAVATEAAWNARMRPRWKATAWADAGGRGGEDSEGCEECPDHGRPPAGRCGREQVMAR